MSGANKEKPKKNGVQTIKCPMCKGKMHVRISGPRAMVGRCTKCNFRMMS